MLTRFEDQNIEWKRSWKDEYLKTICGFANAQGGSIYIGVDDEGKIVGVILEKDTSVQRYERKLADEDELKQLLVSIPNKVQHALSLIVDVNLLSESGLHYIEIPGDAALKKSWNRAGKTAIRHLNIRSSEMI